MNQIYPPISRIDKQFHIALESRKKTHNHELSSSPASSEQPELINELNDISFEDLLSPPPDLNTAKLRFIKQKKLYEQLSDHEISWEEAKYGIKSVPSFTAPSSFYEGLRIIKMPQDILDNAERSRMFSLTVLNHPVRIKNLIESQKKSFIKASLAHSRVLDHAETDHKLLTFSDIAAVQPDLSSERLHRRVLLSNGPFIPTSLKPGRGTRLPIASGSMITGNPYMIAAIAMCGVLATTYKEGLCSVPKIQASVTEKAVDIIYNSINNDPLWSIRSDKDTLLDFWLNQIGITVGTNIEDSLYRVNLLMPQINKGKLKGLSVRVYNPQVSKEAVNTVSALRREFGDILEIFAGQANSVEYANELIDAGADAIGVGIGGGLRCTTSLVSGVAVSTLRDLWRLRGKINAPIYVDSSVSYYWALALLLGASMLVKPSHMVGIESMGGLYPYTDGSNYYISYHGEASGVNKEFVGRLMRNGKPFAAEGVGGFAQIDLQNLTISDQILSAIINFLTPPFVFQGTASGRRFENIQDMHKESNLEFLWELSEESRKIRGAWGPAFHNR